MAVTGFGRICRSWGGEAVPFTYGKAHPGGCSCLRLGFAGPVVLALWCCGHGGGR